MCHERIRDEMISIIQTLDFKVKKRRATISVLIESKKMCSQRSDNRTFCRSGEIVSMTFNMLMYR